MKTTNSFIILKRARRAEANFLSNFPRGENQGHVGTNEITNNTRDKTDRDKPDSDWKAHANNSSFTLPRYCSRKSTGEGLFGEMLSQVKTASLATDSVQRMHHVFLLKHKLKNLH